jgi:PPOX class probable F420-dependent enzyme
MPALTPSERDEFLNRPGVLVRIATIQADGAPHVTPAWFIYENGEIYMTPRAASTWLDNLRRDSRIALTIDEDPTPYRKVTVEGRARIVHETGEDDIWRDLYRRITRRYVSPEGAEAYIQSTIDQPRALLAVPLSGSKVRSWRMPVDGESHTGIWHRRYYVEGSAMAQHAGEAR